MGPKYRIEKDVLGNVKVPYGAYYGSETERAKENFPISGMHMQQSFIIAYATLKKAAAISNMKVGKLEKDRALPIIKACNEIISGKLYDQFVVDIFQAGAGTSTNMNLNEVIANRALELAGRKKGDYRFIHPNDHVNMSQSTNDTYHAATRIAAYLGLKNLSGHLKRLESALALKSKEFSGIIKIGRTHLQDAVPMTLGQEFEGYKGSVEYAMKSLNSASKELLEIPLGGTALGTGINASKDYQRTAIRELNNMLKARFKHSANIFAGMQNEYAEIVLGNALETAAILIGKISNDFRLLGSGPNAGLNELILPPVQPGSSIMPGKINPSMAEMLNMVCFQVMGNCKAIRESANAGQLELNVFMPIIAFNLLYSIDILSNGIDSFTQRCAKGVKANTKAIEKHIEMDTSIATALSPYIGYAKAAEIAQAAHDKGKSVREICIAMGIMDKTKLDKILDPKNLI